MVADEALLTFAREQSAQAVRAEDRGHWAEAARVWDLVVLAAPDDPQARARFEHAAERARAAAAARVSTAEAARRRGDLEAAAQAYLEALAQDPRRTDAAQALRLIEQDRERRRLAARNARIASQVAAPGLRPAGETPAAQTAVDAEAARRLQAAREHASMLASQGDLDGAIQLLRDAMSATSPDPGSRTQLADFYVRRAESVRRHDPRAARLAVDAALALDRRHAGALALLRQLTGSAGLPAPQPRP